jgi:hypothetical protein
MFVNITPNKKVLLISSPENLSNHSLEYEGELVIRSDLVDLQDNVFDAVVSSAPISDSNLRHALRVLKLGASLHVKVSVHD